MTLSPLAQEMVARLYTRTGLDRLPAHLEERYGIEVLGAGQLDIATYRIDRVDGPPWVARVFPAARPIELAEGDAEVLRFLEANGLPAERCAHAKPVSALEGQPVLVTEFVEGPKAQPTARVLGDLGDMLGRLQTLPAGPGAVSREAGALHHWSPLGGLPRAGIDAALAWLGDAEPLVPAEQRALCNDLRDHVAAIDDLSDLPRALIHPDFQHEKVIAPPNSGLVVSTGPTPVGDHASPRSRSCCRSPSGVRCASTRSKRH